MRAILFVAASVFVCSTPAAAQSVRVNLSDLNLSVASDADEAYTRISAAVREVCADSGTPSVFNKHARARCERLTLGDTVAELDNPQLSRRHAEAQGALQVATAD